VVIRDFSHQLIEGLIQGVEFLEVSFTPVFTVLELLFDAITIVDIIRKFTANSKAKKFIEIYGS